MANDLGMLITGFIVILVGIIFIGVVADSVEDVSVGSILMPNDTVALNASMYQQTGTLGTASDEYEIIQFVEVRNNTDAKDITSLCDLTFSTWTLNCTNTGNETAYVDYNYEPDNYVKSSTAATVIRLTTLFFAIAVMLWGAGMAFIGIKGIII